MKRTNSTRTTRICCAWALLLTFLWAPAWAQESAVPAGDAKPISFLNLLVRGGWFMVPLAACSLLGVALIAERYVALRRKAVIPPQFEEQLLRRLSASPPDVAAAREYCQANVSPMSRVILAGLRKYPLGEAAMEEAIEDAGAIEVSRLRNNFRMLNGVATVAPMLGLLGTVWGMIEAFRVASMQGLGQAEMLAEGIYHALVTTLAGLMIAIPVLMFYFYFQSRIDAIVADMNDISVAMFDKLFGSHGPDHPIHANVQGQAHPHRAAAAAASE